MTQARIYIEIRDTEYLADIEYNYFPGVEPITWRLPEDCDPGEPDEWELINLVLMVPSHGGFDEYNIDFFIEDNEDYLIEKIQEADHD